MSSSSAGVRSSQPPPDTLRLVLRGRAESSKPSRYRGGRLARVALSTSDGRVKDLRESAYFFFGGGTRPAGRGDVAARFLSALSLDFFSARLEEPHFWGSSAAAARPILANPIAALVQAPAGMAPTRWRGAAALSH